MHFSIPGYGLRNRARQADSQDRLAKTVVIGAFPGNGRGYGRDYAVVAIDVIRATTTAITAVAQGRRCFPVASVQAAHALAARLRQPLLAGELEGVKPPQFDLNNSPAALAMRTDIHRPLVLLSSSGTKLMHSLRGCGAAYLACFRNYEAVARLLASRITKVALIGAATRGEFREEDQMCCAWIAEKLIAAGYTCEDDVTSSIIRRWRGMHPNACSHGASARYLIRSKQLEDLEFILARINDLDSVYTLRRGEVVRAGSGSHGRRFSKRVSEGLRPAKARENRSQTKIAAREAGERRQPRA